MKELLELAFTGANLVPAVLGAISIIYWLLVLIGLFDFQSMDVEADVHADAHVDVHADAHADVQADAHADADTSISDAGMGLKGILTFFNLGKVPLMLILSFVALFWWLGSIALNYYLGLPLWLGLVLHLPLFIGSLLVSKFFTAPFGKLFEKMNQFAQPLNAVGMVGEITIEFQGDQIGQMRVMGEDGWVNLSAKAPNNGKYLRGDKVVVTEFIQDQNYYLIEPLNLD